VEGRDALTQPASAVVVDKEERHMFCEIFLAASALLLIVTLLADNTSWN
jgi:hypothetical protein